MRKTSLVLAALLAVAGICVMLWPMFTGHRLQSNAATAVQEFLAEHNEPEQRYTELLEALQEYNRQLYTEKQCNLTDIEACETPAADLTAYGIEDEIIGVLEIPAMELIMPVYLGASDDNLAAGAAVLGNTSAPIGGTNTNCVIAGHRGWKGADYPTLKNICEGRSLPAYEAAAEFTSRAAEELDGLLSELGGDKGALNTLEKLETARDAAAEELAKLLDARAHTREMTEPGKQALINAANRLDSKQRQVEAVSQMLDTTMLRQTEAVDLAVSAAVQAAAERAQEVQSIIGAWSDEPMNMCHTPENLALLEKVRQSTALKDISKYLGRFREIFTQAKKNSYAYGRGETYSLELGNNLSRALTSELAMLATPETIPLFLRKYQQKQIKQYRRREPIYKGMGDIICCLDESGSTEGECALSDGCQQELQASQAAHHFTVTGILLDKGRAGMGFSLSPFCQKIYRTSELTGDAVVQSMINLRA